VNDASTNKVFYMRMYSKTILLISTV